MKERGVARLRQIVLSSGAALQAHHMINRKGNRCRCVKGTTRLNGRLAEKTLDGQVQHFGCLASEGPLCDASCTILASLQISSS